MPDAGYRTRFYSFVPPWLATDNGEKYMYTLELSRDVLYDMGDQAIKLRFPGVGDPSQIPFLAFDRNLTQGPAESDASFTLRLSLAFQTWALAGSARAVLLNLQAYMQGLQPGVPAAYPLATIVGKFGGPPHTHALWQQLYQGDALGTIPARTVITPSNFEWDGNQRPWWQWLVLPMALVSTGQSGSSAQTTTAGGGSFTNPGQNVGGVWVPATNGTPVNAPFVTITGLSGLDVTVVGKWLTMSGSSHAGNNGVFPIVQFLSPTSVVIANPSGVTSDAGPLMWSVGEYPFIGPGMPYGSPGVVYGEGETTIPPIDTGHNFGGVWQPTTPLQGYGPLTSWGLDVSPNVIESIRDLVKTWKSAGTYYPNIIIAFDCGNGAAGNAYSPNSASGSGNPDGFFGSVGHNVGGVWSPTRLINSTADCYCQGTGRAVQCSIENVT